MATWVIADRVLDKVSGLDRHGFCVGNIAPDCNVGNEDWTSFTPSRTVTHWMSGERKAASDCDRFYEEYIENRKDIKTDELKKSSGVPENWDSVKILIHKNDRMKDIYSMEADY